MNLEIEIIKEILKSLLNKIGGSCTVCRLGDAYVNNFDKRIDLKKFGFRKFTGLLRNFPDVFNVYKKDEDLFVELIPEEILSFEASSLSCCNVNQFLNSSSTTERKKDSPRKRILRYVEKQKTSIFDPIELTVKRNEPRRLPSPTPSSASSLQSITLSEFLEARIPSSSRVQSEIDEESEVDWKFGTNLNKCEDLDFSFSILDSDESNILEKTIQEFENTPMIVHCTNPFLPSLARIEVDKVFEGIREESRGNQAKSRGNQEKSRGNKEKVQETEEETTPEEDEGSRTGSLEVVNSQELDHDTLKYSFLASELSGEDHQQILDLSVILFEANDDLSEREISDEEFCQEYKQFKQNLEESFSYRKLKDETSQVKIKQISPQCSSEYLHESMESQSDVSNNTREFEKDILNNFQNSDEVEESEIFTGFKIGSISNSSVDSSLFTHDMKGLSVDREDSDEDGSGALSYKTYSSFEDSMCGEFKKNIDKPCSSESLAKIPVDVEFYLNQFSPVVRDASVKLHNQIIPHGKSFTLHLTEMFSPVRFWFHYEHEVTIMMEWLQRDYEKLKASDLLISDRFIVPGLLVCCYYEIAREWSRVEIVNMLDENDRARVFFVDFGTVGLVHKKNFKYLYQKYLDYPCYGHRGSLLNLQPPGGDISWSVSSVERFLEKFSNKEMVAKVVQHVQDDNSFVLDIEYMPRKSTTAVNLRTWSIRNGIAKELTVLPGRIPPFCYSIEVFDELEKNFPTYHEKSMLKEKGINYDILVESNFLLDIGNENGNIVRPGHIRLLGNEMFEDIKNYHFG